MPDQWAVIITGPDMINDLKKAHDDYLSFDEAIKDVCTLLIPKGNDRV